MTVMIVLKQDQHTGKFTKGIVKDILTKSPTHPHGIKLIVSETDLFQWEARLFPSPAASPELVDIELFEE